MSLRSRIANVFRSSRVNSSLDEEMQSHLEEAIASGRDPVEARRAFGSPLQLREASREFKLVVWLDAVCADTVFGLRQLIKHRIPSAAAVLSLALAIGACMSAFRLIDALLLRPLPVASPELLSVVTYPTGDSFEYPHFRQLRAAVKGDAEVMAMSLVSRIGLTFGTDAETERVTAQFVSGWTFATLGLKPAVGRLFTANDDLKPGAHPVAVLSYDYWQRRFGGDPNALGRAFRCDNNQMCEVVGVIEPGFTGTETGTFTDVYLPTMMMYQRAVERRDWSWVRAWVRLNQGVAIEPVRQKLQAASRAFREDNARSFGSDLSDARIVRQINTPVSLEPAVAGVSGLQKDYRRSMVVLGVLVALVLLIACANVANLMTAQSAARAREMALRVSIGAGRWRLVQLVLVESALLAMCASVLGALFAWCAAPFVVSAINPPDNPARLALSTDWRVLVFSVVLTIGVTFLFGLVPALRASAVRPVSALKGGEDPHARRRLMNVLLAAQVAFCFVVQFVAGLFVATFDRLANQPTGFASERLLALQAVAKGGQPIANWNQVMEHLRGVAGVESVALSGWALMSGSSIGQLVSIGGELREDAETYFLTVSPGWFETMRIPMIGGRDFRSTDLYSNSAVVNEEFARRFFDGQNPIGKSFERLDNGNRRVKLEIVGYVRDARYRNMREPIRPTAYVPFNDGAKKDWATFVIRTTTPNPLTLVPLLRQEVPRARSEFRPSNVHTQTELVQSHTVRERLLAMLAFFFAAVSLVLAAVGLFGVLDFSVQQRRREIGIRMALGARAVDVARRVTVEVFAMAAIGGCVGLAAGLASEHYLESLFYHVKATDLTMLALPAVTILCAALLAALPPLIRAVRIDPASMLRAD